MSKAFEATVCARFKALLNESGYQGKSRCAFTKSNGASFAVVWLVEGQRHVAGQFMPRLSIGLGAVGEDVAVLSKDLHQLVSPDGRAWYRWKDADDEILKSQQDLVKVGLPWLEAHLQLDLLARTLEEGVIIKVASDDTREWQSAPPGSKPDDRINSNNLQFLSYCYEALGRHSEALASWDQYRASLPLLDEASERAKRIRDRRMLLVVNAGGESA